MRTLVTGPVVVSIGGISAVFSHAVMHMASDVPDAYIAIDDPEPPLAPKPADHYFVHLRDWWERCYWPRVQHHAPFQAKHFQGKPRRRRHGAPRGHYRKRHT